MKAIILCGGLGTRLGALTKDMPKPLLNVAGRPFISYVLDRLAKAGINGFVLAAGFQWSKLHDYIGDEWNSIPVQYSVETEPLGTGGAIKKALSNMGVHETIVVNGDTLFDINIQQFLQFAIANHSMASIALRKVEDCSRYGRVTVNSQGRITSFGEKDFCGEGFINGGVYYLRSNALDSIVVNTFSFERAFLEHKYPKELIFGMVFDEYFIDIGVPADLHRAQTDLIALKL
jgi:D-glycero-alpha-D-manno-heptose 1-phosphate guanylyltransferase